jgi:hypothetical protein
LQDGVTFKADGSPVTSVEGKIECSYATAS